MDIIKLQQGLLYWFRMSNPVSKSYASIENICINLCKPYFTTETSPADLAAFARSNIFFPLLRSGIVEFYGDGKYAIAPSACNYNQAFVAGCNLPATIKEDFNADLEYDSLRGIAIYRRSGALLHAIDAASIPCQAFLFRTIAGKIPSLGKVVSLWEDDVFIDGSGYQQFVPGEGWRRCAEPVNTGVFRKSDKVYSQRVVKTGDYRWKLVPSRTINPDAMNIAVSWAATGTISGLAFNSRDLLLSIKNNAFPLLIERILAINSLLHGYFLHDERRYLMTLAEFNQLNNILGNKIDLQ